MPAYRYDQDMQMIYKNKCLNSNFVEYKNAYEIMQIIY